MVPSTTLEKRYERGRERPRFVSHCKFRLGLGCICELHMCRVGCACACACACCVSVTMGPGYGSNSVRASLSSKSGGGAIVCESKKKTSPCPFWVNHSVQNQKENTSPCPFWRGSNLIVAESSVHRYLKLLSGA